MTAAIGMGLAVGWVLALGCAVDKLLARIPAVERYISSLPLGAPIGHACPMGRGGAAERTSSGGDRRSEEVELVTTIERIKRRKRRARRRRMFRRLAVCAVLAGLAVTSSWTTWDKPRQEPRRLPDRSTLAWMMNQAALSPGHARAFADQYPELSDLFLGAAR